MDQQQTGDASNAAWGWSCAELRDVFVCICENERRFYTSLRLRQEKQRRYITNDADWINAMRNVGCDHSIVPLIVSVRRVVAEK